MMLGALELVVFGMPAQRRVLMGTGQVERVRLAYRAHQNHLIVPVDRRPVRIGNGIRVQRVVYRERAPEAPRQGRDKRRGQPGAHVTQELAPAGDGAVVTVAHHQSDVTSIVPSSRTTSQRTRLATDVCRNRARAACTPASTACSAFIRTHPLPINTTVSPIFTQKSGAVR